ncbi:MAG: hypothetical protein Q7U08_05750 [Flavobacteriaceae bacterium]|nr:hypothetical protein [Flavobacteriaceae bacterium]
MEITKNKYRLLFPLIMLVLHGLYSSAQEFDSANYRMIYDFKTIKQSDNSRLLEINFSAWNNENSSDVLPVYEAEIKIYNILDDQKVLLGTAKTSKQGIAQLTLPANQKYLTNKEGNITLSAQFDGNDKLNEEQAEITFKNVQLELNLTEIEGVKTAIAKVYKLDNSGNETPVEADISLYVNSMFAKMKIGEGSVSDGELEYQFEFPTDLPGDINDQLTIYLMIEDHEEFGNVIQQQTAKWGAAHTHKKEKKLTLWSKSAPIWMYIVLTVLLVGIWSNYIYTIINLFKIKEEGKMLETNL